MQCDVYHPHQALADLMTIIERFGDPRGRTATVSWACATSYQKPISVPQSLIMLLPRFGMNGRVAVVAIGGNSLIKDDSAFTHPSKPIGSWRSAPASAPVAWMNGCGSRVPATDLGHLGWGAGLRWAAAGAGRSGRRG
jgi:hypothetical protein